MTPDFTIGQGDTLPVFEYQLLSPNGAPADLTTLNVSTVMLVIGLVPGSTMYKITGSVVTAATGNVSAAFSSTDTSVAGMFEAFWETTDNVGNIQHYPNDGPLHIQITQTLS